MAANVRAGVWLGVWLMAGSAMAQAPQVTETDYRRAASMLADRTAPLLDRVVSAPVWLDDGTLVYRERSGTVEQVLRFDPATGRTTPELDRR